VALPTARVIALSPCWRPDARLVQSACKAGYPAFLDLGDDLRAARAALMELRTVQGFGVRLGAAPIAAADLPAGVDLVLLAAGADIAPWRPRTVLVEVTDVNQAVAAVAAGADGLVATGWESGGSIGEETAFVLLQRLLMAVDVPIWVRGGLGPHAAAACVAGGAAGVVLDDQLLLTRGSRIPGLLRDALPAMDGSETTVEGGVRLWRPVGRPDAPAIPLGAGAAFAADLAREHRTVAGVLGAYDATIDDDRRLAARLQPLAPGNALAARWGLRYPIAQGPMTRVSDRAAFAEAVCDGGGLAFLALSLMRGAAARDLLRDTAARLAGRTWGVGILGFAPPELRREQLALLAEVRPPVVLIAGGRPSQARALEEQGIETWLHVPSPGLLAMYLAEGARRFVFEGRESGGHVGPRGSLALWEAQVQQLLAFDALEDVSVLFAGGVHDGRSAAMVATLAAPLAARGASVGVLMGTAYLFTREAVDTGAILPGFQHQARRCAQTTVLQTAPGHATRCVDSPYVHAFEAERARLIAAGKDPQEVWAALETLNLGRLRIAAKGLARQGAEIVSVDADQQERDGLFMVGQVAALRDELTTIAALHADVSEGSVQALHAHDLPEPVTSAGPRRPDPVDIAIVGMACVYPDAPDLDAFWAHVLDAVDAVHDVPDDRWSARIFWDPESRGAEGGQTYARTGGWLPAIRFDPLAYGIPPRSLIAIEPVQLLALEVARRALSDAGYADRDFDRNRTAVVFGAEAGTELAGAYGFRTLYRQYVGPLPAELDAVLPTYTEDTFPGVLANVIAGRIANRLDLGGANFTVDAACGSSLAAVDVAVKELVSGTADMVLAGGADLHNGINDFVMFSSVHALSRTGRPRCFDADADGTIIGEGVAAVVLKRLADARRDGDRIYGVIKGVGAASDGRSLGLTAPRRLGQVRAVRRAYDMAGMPAQRVGLVEAHGTGTVVGDKTELSALTEVFDGRAPGTCVLGSVKSQIGHTKCAAGMAGLIKSTLAVYTGVRPPTINLSEPNPYWQGGESPFTFLDRPQPWADGPRAAGVSAFGFGGTNFHVVVEQPPDEAGPDVTRRAWPAELFLFRGSERRDALARLSRLRALVARGWDRPLRDLARATSTGGQGPVWIAVVAGSLDELDARLVRAEQGIEDPRGIFSRDPAAPADDGGGKLAFLFPGQGSQRPGMLADLFVEFPVLQRILRQGARWLPALFPPQAFDDATLATQLAAITDTTVAQPTLGMADLAMAQLLARLGLRPDMVAGHSYGELVALCVADALDEADLLDLSEARGRCILDAAGQDPGAMAAVAATATQIDAVLGADSGVVLANHNAPDQVVLAGPADALDAACQRLEDAGLKPRRLPVACAFHSPVVAAAADSFATRLDAVPVRAPRLPVWSNTTAAPYPEDPDAVRARLAEQIARPVRFVDEIEAMYAAGARVFVEVGPGGVLTRLVGRVLDGRPHVAVATDDGRTHGLVRLQLALARLAVSGVGFDCDVLFEDRDAARFDLAHPPPPAGKPTDWLVDGHLARPAHGSPLPGAMLPVTEPVVQGPVGGLPPAEAEREQVVSSYLDTMRKLVESQREVMLAYLGAPAPAASGVVPDAAGPVAVAPDPAAPIAAEPVPDAEESLDDLLLGIVSERTGYPIEMLDLDLDLEADLSIDSIKRIEILGLLGERIGLTSADTAERDAIIEQLAAVRTLRGVLAWLDERMSGDEDVDDEVTAPTPLWPSEAPASPDATVEGADGPPLADATPVLGRFIVEVEPVAPPSPAPRALRGHQIMLADDGVGVAEALAARLVDEGADVRVVAPGTLPENGEDLVDLTALGAGERPEPARHLFAWARAAAGDGERRLLAATGLGGALGQPGVRAELPTGGPAGLLKTVARERPELRVRVVDVDPASAPEDVARVLATELASVDGPQAATDVEVGWQGDVRVRQFLREAPLDCTAPPRLVLGPDAVVLVTGGARGIAARAALALMGEQPCRLELVGRTPPPGPETDDEVAAASDRAALRRLFLSRGDLKSPRDIEAACDRVLAARQIRDNLAALAATGATVRYHAVDVRDADAFGALIDGLYDEHGRLDGVVHAAGVLEDKLLLQKTPESFDRVFDTKVVGARVIARHLRPGARFVVFFGSVSGVLGNRGQVDYAAANDALDKLARTLNGRLAERVLSIDWGPWGGGGMVSAELEREYNRRGVGLIDPDQGARAFVDELLHGAAADAQVLWMCGSPESLV